VKSLLLWLAKRRLRAAYLGYINRLDEATCGRELAGQLPSVIKARAHANHCLDRVCKLDPGAPLPSRIT
jgi:hypothetical protein